MNKRLSTGAITGIVITAVVVVLALMGVGTYNSLAKADQSVDAKWSQVENVMQRRYDLIPNLVSAVKGSMKQEQKVFGAIADARSSYTKANTTKEKANANAKLNSSVGTLITVIREDYPSLKSNEQVQTLMNQLEGSENRIAVERKRYNEAVESYNQSVVTFPKNMFANAMGMGKKDYFKADANASKAPTVDLDTDSGK
jgi:LemA protein